jgi:lysophospholipase L1-like esterase
MATRYPDMNLIHGSIAFHNVAELEAVPGLPGLRLQRFPADLRDRLGFKSHTRGRFWSHRVAGCEIRFVTEGPFVRVALSAMETDAVVIVYKGDCACSRHVLPAGVVSSLFLEDPAWFSQVDPELTRGRRFAPTVWRLLFHQDAAVCFHHLDAFGHAVRPPTTGETPAVTWLAYGSSITHGASVFHPSNSYTQHAAWLLGVDVLNKGLPGSCMCETEMAAWLAALPGWDFATLELGVNLVDWATPEEFEPRARHLIATVHGAGRPTFVTDIFPNRADWMLDHNAIPAVRTPAFREIIQRLVAQAGHPNLRFIEARGILQDPLTGLNSDLLHPSDEGHIAMGAALARQIARFIPGNGP